MGAGNVKRTWRGADRSPGRPPTESEPIGDRGDEPITRIPYSGQIRKQQIAAQFRAATLGMASPDLNVRYGVPRSPSPDLNVRYGVPRSAISTLGMASPDLRPPIWRPPIRHRFASDKINLQKLDSLVVARLMGHSNSRMLEQTYFREDTAVMVEAMKKPGGIGVGGSPLPSS